jgi:dTDP-4-amino-4,6-dideoxygalactose transaminase
MIKFNDLSKQFQYIEDSVRSRLDNLFKNSDYILGNDVRIFEENFAAYTGTKYTLGVSSGTDAITLGVESLVDPNKSTLIITQANTYIATIFGILNGLHNDSYSLQIIDCDDYGQMNMEQLEKCLNANRHRYQTCIVVPVHMFGGCVDVETLLILKDKYRFMILEDSAQAHGTITSTGLKTGSIGDVAAFSFYPGKNLGACGDAGAITTNNSTIYHTINKLRNMGCSSKYRHTMPGHNMRLDSIQAIILDEKLKKLDSWNSKRNIIADIYFQRLHYNIRPPYCSYHTYHLFPWYTNNPQQYLNNANIQFGQHYPHTVNSQILSHPHLRYSNIYINRTPIAEKNTQHITLPIHPYMTTEEANIVCDKLSE